MSHDEDDRDPWYAEADAIATDLQHRDFDVAQSAELPHELSHFAMAAAADESFDSQFDEWLEYLFEGDDLCLLLAIEQSCDEAVLLPWDMRAVRLRTVPSRVLAQLHWFLEACPHYVRVHLVCYAYWLVRSERARRRGSPSWSPSMTKPPVPDYEQEPALKPMRSWPSRWP